MFTNKYFGIKTIISFLIIALCLIGKIAPAFAEKKSDKVLTHVAPTAWEPFHHYTVPRTDGSKIDLFIAAAKKKPAPTIVVFGGSKCLPVVMLKKNRTVSALMFFGDLAGQSGRVNIVVVEKRGLKSFGPPPESQEKADQMMKSAFEKGLYLKETRVNDGIAVVEALLASDSFKDIHLVGHSEGGDVVSGICRAVAGRGIKSAALMAGAGPTRFFETSVQARSEKGAAGVKSVLDREIFLSVPGNARTPEDLQQVTYAIVSSPLDDLKGLNVPLFIAHGDADVKTPAAAADVFAAEMFRVPSQPLTYLMLPGLDHGFVDPKGEDRSGELLDYYVNWVLSGKYGRSIIIGLPEKKPAK